MLCFCGERTMASDCRDRAGGYFRFRKCRNGHRFKTVETIATTIDRGIPAEKKAKAIEMILAGRPQKFVSYELGIHRNTISKLWTEYQQSQQQEAA